VQWAKASDPVAPPESRGNGRSSGVPSPGLRTSPPGVRLPSRVLAEPGSGSSASRSPPALRALARGSGVFPGPAYPGLRGAPGPLLGFGPPPGFSTDRSGRPVPGPAPPMGFFRPYDDLTPAGPDHPGFAAPGTFRPQGFDPLAGFLPADAADPKTGAAPGVHPSGPCSLRPAALVSEPLPSCRFSVLPAFSSEDEKVGSAAAAPGLSSDRRAAPFRGVVPPFRACALLGCLPLRSSGPAAMEPASRLLPSCAFPTGRPKPSGRRRSRVSLGSEVRRALTSPPASLGSAASARPELAPEGARRRAAVGARSEFQFTRRAS